MDFSMCPNGAFMMHESVTEYDPVAKEIADYREDRENQNTNSIPVVSMDLVNDSQDPVAKVQSEFGKIYEDDILRLLNLSYAPTDKEETIGILDDISEMATRISDKFRKCIVKQIALIKYYSEPMIEYEQSSKYAGELIKNLTYFKQQGYSQYTESFNINFMFQRRFSTTEFINIFYSYPDFVKHDLSTVIMNLSFWDNKFSDNFADPLDMLKCIYADSGRFNRLEVSESYSYSLENMLNIPIGTYHGTKRCEDEIESHSELIRFISMTLRDICQSCYNIQCMIMDDENVNTDVFDIHFQKKLKEVITEILNIFIIGTVDVISNAYVLRGEKCRKDSVTNYVNILISNLKNKK